MTYSLPIRQPNSDRTNWWSNFTKISRVEKFGPGWDYSPGDWINYRDSLLKQANAKYDGKYVHFATEKDAVVFILRWI